MASTITIPYEDKEYTLRYSRATVIKMEKDGFNVGNYMTQPLTTALQLFAGAFLANHPTVKRNLVDKIYDSLGNKEGLIDVLIDMYNEVVEKTMTNRADTEDMEKNPGWELNVTP